MPESPHHIRPADYTWRDLARILLGVIMLVLGLLGLVLPILQGLLFLLIAALLIAPYSRRVRQLLDAGQRRFPGVVQRASRIKQRFCKSKQA